MRISTRLFLALVLLFQIGVGLPFAASADDEVSIMKPAAVSGNSEYRFKLDAVDPMAPNESQMVVYTPASGVSTQTGASNVEAVVVNGVVTTIGGGNTSIPKDGFVASARGSAAQWLTRFARPGALLSYDNTVWQLSIKHTPQVYLNEVDSVISQAQSRQPANAERYTQLLNEAVSCRKSLDEQAASGQLTPELIRKSNQCLAVAQRAFYNTIPSIPGEFRGTWIRPSNNFSVENVRKNIAKMQSLGIQNIFLETYYQGRTTYPSDVMAAYGLPNQHAQFMGQDPVKLWVEEAHKAGMKVHLWVEVFFAGNQDENPEPYGPILQKYPQWRNIQRRHWNVDVPVISDVEPGHYFLDPANPEVRSFLEKLFLEMLTRYEADGLNLDYIRYPASAAMSVPNYLNSTWGYTDTARKAFQALIQQEHDNQRLQKIGALKKAGKPIPKSLRTAAVPAAKPGVPSPYDPVSLTPSNPLWPRWTDWRKNNVTSFVKNISEKAHAIRPNLLISAVVFPLANPLYSLKLQDYPLWTREGYIQALTPIGLSARPELLQPQAAKLKTQVPDQFPIYVGIFGMYNRATPMEFVEQIDAAHQAKTAGIMLFEWSRIRPEYEEALKEGPFRQ